MVNDVPPRERDIAMVFQNYALYPYMTVFDNIAFGLRARKTPQAEIDAKVRPRRADAGHRATCSTRYPRQLSGGQLQRVAIGRAIVRNARLYLFDEPLSNLDAQLRDEMRGEIKRLHQELGKTMIYVTHDQIEAMTMADRIVLLRDGRIEQQGAPLDLYERPATRYVAGFLGSPAMNFMPARAGGRRRRPRGAAGRRHAAAAAARRAANAAPAGATSAVDAGRAARAHRAARARRLRARPGRAARPRSSWCSRPASRTYATFQLGGAEVVAELQAHDVSQPGETHRAGDRHEPRAC